MINLAELNSQYELFDHIIENFYEWRDFKRALDFAYDNNLTVIVNKRYGQFHRIEEFKKDPDIFCEIINLGYDLICLPHLIKDGKIKSEDSNKYSKVINDVIISTGYDLKDTIVEDGDYLLYTSNWTRSRNEHLVKYLAVNVRSCFNYLGTSIYSTKDKRVIKRL